jgi:hypothetical protein
VPRGADSTAAQREHYRACPPALITTARPDHTQSCTISHIGR